MKPLVIACLMASALFAAASATPTELCTSGGPLSSTTANAPSTAANNCIWPGGTMLTVSANAEIVDISGGNSGLLNMHVLGGRTTALALVIRNGFTAVGAVSIFGTLPVGSSIAITDTKISLPGDAAGSTNLDLSGITLASGSTLTVSDSAFASGKECYPCNTLLPPKADLSTVTINQASMTFVKLSNSNTFDASILNVTNNTFTSTSDSNEGIGLEVERLSAAAAYSSAAAPADWADVSAEDARTVYGKSAFIIADNTFDEIFAPWQVKDLKGSDFIASGNKAALIRRTSSRNWWLPPPTPLKSTSRRTH